MPAVPSAPNRRASVSGANLLRWRSARRLLTDPAILTTSIPARVSLWQRLGDRFSTVTQWSLARLDGWHPGLPGVIPAATLSPPPGVSWADPFPVVADGREVLFVEEKSGPGGKGRLAVIDPSGSPPSATPVIEDDGHLSYPFVFRWLGDWFLIPESRQSGSVPLYRATRYPFEWRLETRLLEAVDLVDATLLDYGGAWHLFGTSGANGSEYSLWHFRAPTPVGPWSTRDATVVRRAKSGLRGAGRFFAHGGALFRPAQKYEREYGQAVILNRVTVLDGARYAEEPMVELTWQGRRRVSGFHTLNEGARGWYIDVKRRLWWLRRVVESRGRRWPRSALK